MAAKIKDSIAHMASGGKMSKLRVLLILCFTLFLGLPVLGQTGVNNAELNGNYAFTFTGISGNGTASSAFGAMGRLTLDGAGNLSNVELVTTAVAPGPTALKHLPALIR